MAKALFNFLTVFFFFFNVSSSAYIWYMFTHISRPATHDAEIIKGLNIFPFVVWLLPIFLLLGTMLFYQPGLLTGGPVDHDCNTQRSIGYYLEALIMLAPFMKSTLKATLRGVTNDPIDPSVRTLRVFFSVLCFVDFTPGRHWTCFCNLCLLQSHSTSHSSQVQLDTAL